MKCRDNSVRGRAYGFLAGLLGRLKGRRRAGLSPDDLRQAEFRTSTRRIGVRFTDRIRDVYRRRWLRKVKD